MQTSTRRRGLLWQVLAATFALALLAGACSDEDDASTETGSGDEQGQSVSDASEEDLAKWQEDLNAVGCWAGAVDGTMGPETEAAIKEYQEAKGLTVDGKLGPQTESALAADAAAGTTVCTSSSGTSTTSTTSGGGGEGECPGPECYQVTINPTSGPVGTEIEVSVTESGCMSQSSNPDDNTVSFGPAGGGGVLVVSDPLSMGAGSGTATLTVPSDTEPGDYWVIAPGGKTDDPEVCVAPFTVTG